MLINSPILIAIRRTQTRVHHSRHLEILEIVTLPAVTRNCRSTAQGSTYSSASADILFVWDFFIQSNVSMYCTMDKWSAVVHIGRISSLFLPMTTRTTRGDFWKDNILAVKKVKPGIFVLFFALMLQQQCLKYASSFVPEWKRKFIRRGKIFHCVVHKKDRAFRRVLEVLIFLWTTSHK